MQAGSTLQNLIIQRPLCESIKSWLAYFAASPQQAAERLSRKVVCSFYAAGPIAD